MFISSIQELGAFNSDATGSRAKLGTKVETDDGRVFRFCLNSSTPMVAGTLYQAPPVVTNHQNLAVAVVAAIGSKLVTVTLGGSAATSGQYSEGYLLVNAGAGIGHTYKISGNPAQTSTSGSLVLTLEDPVKVALDTTTSKVCLVPNLYNQPVISATAQSGTAVGVAPFAIPASAYGWLQTRGIVSGIGDATPLTAGLGVTISGNTNGDFETIDAAGEAQIGIAIQTGVSTETRAVLLQID